MTVKEVIAIDRLARVRRLTASGEAAAIRRGAGISAGELARFVGCSAAAVCRWEAGERRPTGELALAYLRALDRLLAVGERRG